MRVSGGQSGIPVAMSCLACSPAVAYVGMMGRNMKKNKVALFFSLSAVKYSSNRECFIKKALRRIGDLT
jgi:hypothetical protein